MTEWAQEDVDTLISMPNIDVDNPKSLAEVALIKGDVDQAYRICYTLESHRWNNPGIEIDRRFEFGNVHT